MSFLVENLLTEDGWQKDILVQLDEKHRLVSMSETDLKQEQNIQKISGWVIPSFQNAHSHAFQYSMGGLVEHLKRGHLQDDFWSWREKMYQLALAMTPDKMFEVASCLYKELRQQGYGHVAEFHYLHNDASGNRYENGALMSEVLIAASRAADIGITILPMFYQRGGFNKQPLPEQRRFISTSVDAYFMLVDQVRESCKSYGRAYWGVGVHSLRAASSEDVVQIFQHYKDTSIPKHIHISEQVDEVNQCVSQWGLRPVEWLLKNIELDSSFHLVHATHLNQKEILGIAQSQAHVVICPSTEANLGDGIFPMVEFVKHKGRWSIGSDSHICTSPLEELRWLDYVQRLTHGKRNIFCQTGGDDSGDLLYKAALEGGRRAMGLNSYKYFESGIYFDALVIAQAGRFLHAQTERVLSTLIFTGDRTVLKPFFS